jgi:YihY family inner membrane protein
MRRQNRLNQGARQAWAIFRLAARKFLRIDGTKWAGAFAFNAFFSLFPLMLLLVTISSVFIDRDRAAMEVIAYAETFVPLSGDMKAYIFDSVAGMIKARGQAGAVAFLILVWVTLKCFTTLIGATNHAWGTAGYSWWRLPLKSLVLLGTTSGVVLLSIGAPMLAQMARDWLFPMNDFRSWVYTLGSFFISLLVLFFGLSLFYRLAPRRPTRFSEVWAAALCATALLLAAENLFVIYLKNFSTLNAVYGTFGGIMALLLWIYLSGCIFIFGACLSAAQDEAHSAPADSIATRKTKEIEP